MESLSDADNDSCLNANCNENALRVALNELRDLPILSDAMITTYTYDPLVGTTSMTDPKGYTTFYEYDEFNRLKSVKDADGNLYSTNEYNYKTN